MTSERYDVEGKIERAISDEEMRLIVQSLLADRFQLQVTREMKEFPVYELVVASGGHKLSPPIDDGTVGGGLRARRGEIHYKKVGMEMFARFASVFLDRPILDKTSITGEYSFSLFWEAGSGVGLEGSAVVPSAVPPDVPFGPTIFTAIEEQLGLKLQSGKGLYEAIVIERAERPSPN